MSSQSSRTRVERVATACQTAVRGNGGDPCKDCQRLRKACFYPPVQPRKRKAQDKQTVATDGNQPRISIVRVWDARLSSNKNQDDVQGATPLVPTTPLTDAVLALPTSHSENEPVIPASRCHLRSSQQPDTGISEGGLRANFQNQEDGENRLANPNWEYHEPWSGTSICSDIGAKWIWSITGSREFLTIAKRFNKDLVRTTPNDEYVSESLNVPNIAETTAREYVDAFYENCWEADLGIIDRADLEAHLQAHYRNETSGKSIGWMALRNTVFAAGFRSQLAKDPGVSFATAQAKAGCYFRNALSVFTRLLLPPSDLTAIRALILMACYMEGLGNRPLKHFLCSNAVHLAQSKGLHRQPDKAWGNSDNENLKRNWLWWVLYALEKHLALSTGRPSAIDDENISVRLPTTLPTGSNIDSQNLDISTRVSKIHSQLSRRLLSYKALSMSTTERISTVGHFHGQLKQVLEEMPPEFKIGTLGRPPHSDRRLTRILYLHFSIYGSLMALHAHFFYPWMTSRLDTGEYNAALETQIVFSSSTVADAARKIILAWRLVNANVTTPSWLAFHYPIHALINLFIYLLKYPTLSTAITDLGLLDVSVSLPREATNIASKVVKAAKARMSQPTSVESTTAHEQQINNVQMQASGTDGINFDNFEPELTALADVGNFMNLDSTSWNLLSSFDMLHSSTPSS